MRSLPSCARWLRPLTLRALSGGSLACAALLAAACGDDAGSGGGPGAGGAGGGEAGGGGAPETQLLEVSVRRQGSMSGVPGMPVAIDLEGGERIELTTDASGKATTQIDLDAFVSAITHRDGWFFSAAGPSMVARDAAGTGRLVLWTADLSGGEGVRVSGALLNKTGDSSFGLVTATAGRSEFNEEGATDYELFVQPDTPFHLVALEWTDAGTTSREVHEVHHGWAVAEHDGVSSPTTVDLDFAVPAATTTVSGSVTAPDHEQLATQGMLSVVVHGDGAITGFSGETAPLANDVGYSFELDHVAVPGAEVSCTYTVQVGGYGGPYSFVHFGGQLPSAGANDVGFLVPPHRTAPEGDGPYPWSTTIAWTVDPDLADQVGVYYYTEGSAIGMGVVSPTDTSFTMPALPSTSTLLPTTPLYVGVETTEFTTTDGGFVWKEAREAKFEVVSPFAE